MWIVAKRGSNRLRVLVGITLVAVGGASWMAYSLTREHPDYVRAAAGLPKAKKDAEARFGPLTWDEYYRSQGLEWTDHSAAWEAAAKKVPKTIDVILASTWTKEGAREVFQAHREWYLGLRSEIVPLHYWPGHDVILDPVPAKQLIRCIAIGIEGAADAGDYEAVRELTEVAELITKKIVEHPTILQALVATALRSILLQSILTTAVRYPGDEELQGALSEALASMSEIWDVERTTAGEARSALDFLEARRSTPLSQLAGELGLSATPYYDSPGKIESAVRQIFDREDPIRRRFGPHTIDAFGARTLEVLQLYADALTKCKTDYAGGTAMLRRVRGNVHATKDRSYELDEVFLSEMYVSSFLMQSFRLDSARSALALIQRHKRAGDLPATMPSDLVCRDPFTGKDATYVKTTQGFVIATLGSNGFDEGLASLVGNAKSAKFQKPSAGDDMGWVVRF